MARPCQHCAKGKRASCQPVASTTIQLVTWMNQLVICVVTNCPASNVDMSANCILPNTASTSSEHPCAGVTNSREPEALGKEDRLVCDGITDPLARRPSKSSACEDNSDQRLKRSPKSAQYSHRMELPSSVENPEEVANARR